MMRILKFLGIVRDVESDPAVAPIQRGNTQWITDPDEILRMDCRSRAFEKLGEIQERYLLSLDSWPEDLDTQDKRDAFVEKYAADRYAYEKATGNSPVPVAMGQSQVTPAKIWDRVS